MGDLWTDEQFLTLGYDPIKFRGTKRRRVREKAELSMPAVVKDINALESANYVPKVERTEFMDLVLSYNDPVMGFLDQGLYEQLLC